LLREDGIAMHVAHGVIAFDNKGGIVAPFFRVADLVAVKSKLCFRGLSGVFAHPGQGLDIGGEGFVESGHELIHAGLGLGREVRLYPILTNGLAEGAVCCGGALLPTRSGFLLTGECFAEEVEVFVVEGLGEVNRGGMNRVPPEIGLPGGDGLGCDQFTQLFKEVRSSDVEGFEGAGMDVFEIDREIEIRCELLEVGEGIDVIAVFRVAHSSAAGGSLGESRFDRQNGIRFLCGILRRVAGKGEHFGHVVAILLANGLKALAVGEVVIAIG
jgi:hypothetical protein